MFFHPVQNKFLSFDVIRESSANGQNGILWAGTCSFSRWLLCKFPKSWVAKWRNLKRLDLHISFLNESLVYTCSFNLALFSVQGS